MQPNPENLSLTRADILETISALPKKKDKDGKDQHDKERVKTALKEDKKLDDRTVALILDDIESY